MSHRYFTSRVEGAAAFLEGEEAAHLARVLRARPGQTVTLSTPGGANKGAVVIIMPTSSDDFKISGKIRVCGTTFNSKTVQVGAAIHFCVCDGSYWSIGYMPFDDY